MLSWGTSGTLDAFSSPTSLTTIEPAPTWPWTRRHRFQGHERQRRKARLSHSLRSVGCTTATSVSPLNRFSVLPGRAFRNKTNASTRAVTGRNTARHLKSASRTMNRFGASIDLLGHTVGTSVCTNDRLKPKAPANLRESRFLGITGGRPHVQLHLFMQT
jgi:hypothetical protein